MIRFPAILLLIATGCSTPSMATEWGRVVRVHVHGAYGTGSVVGSDLVLTVDHVSPIGETVWVCNGDLATVVSRFAGAPGSYEGLVVLRVTGNGVPYPERDHFDVRSGEPYTVITLDGPHQFEDSQVVPGHSGSPIVDKLGYQVACVSARECPVCGGPDGAASGVREDQRTLPTLVPRGFKLE